MSIFYLSIDDIKTIKHAKQVLNILNNNIIFFLHFINLAIDVPNVENNTACVSSVQKKVKINGLVFCSSLYCLDGHDHRVDAVFCFIQLGATACCC